MRMHFSQIAQNAFSMVLRACEGDSPAVGAKTVIPAELIERSSVRDLTA
jgi:DNA-binding LacI/PurR family transcriptional regulator